MSIGERVHCRPTRSARQLRNYFLGTQGVDNAGRHVVIDDQWTVWPATELTEISIVDSPSAAEDRNATLTRQYGELQEHCAELREALQEAESETLRMDRIVVKTDMDAAMRRQKILELLRVTK